MKLTFFAVTAFLLVSGVTLAQQSGDQKKGSGTMESMPDMMKGKQTGDGGMQGMGNMGNMMGMMKMMEQCDDMMKPAQHDGDQPKESQKK